MRTVDLSSHFDRSYIAGHPADFPVELRPVRFVGQGEATHEIGDRRAVVRTDTEQALAVVSASYTLVTHQTLLSAMDDAIADLDAGPVPRGLYVDRDGAQMRALYKFPALAERLAGRDEICPCVQLRNTYDGTSRVMVSIGAFRFVCTNLAVGGGGVFAGGFMAVHKGEIPIEGVADQLTDFLRRFAAIAELYRAWLYMTATEHGLLEALSSLAQRHREKIHGRIPATGTSVFNAYNAATGYATRQCRSTPLAFRLLESINQGFQREFPAARRN